MVLATKQTTHIQSSEHSILSWSLLRQLRPSFTHALLQAINHSQRCKKAFDLPWLFARAHISNAHPTKVHLYILHLYILHLSILCTSTCAAPVRTPYQHNFMFHVYSYTLPVCFHHPSQSQSQRHASPPLSRSRQPRASHFSLDTTMHESVCVCARAYVCVH